MKAVVNTQSIDQTRNLPSRENWCERGGQSTMYKACLPSFANQLGLRTSRSTKTMCITGSLRSSFHSNPRTSLVAFGCMPTVILHFHSAARLIGELLLEDGAWTAFAKCRMTADWMHRGWLRHLPPGLVSSITINS